MPSESIWMHHHRSSWPDLVEETSLGRCCFHVGGPPCTALWRTSWLERAPPPPRYFTLHQLYCWWRHQASIADFQLTTDQYSPQLRFDYSSSYRTDGRNCRMRASFTEGLCPPHISWLLPNSIAGSIDHQDHQFDSLLSAQDKPCEKYSTSWRTLREEKLAAKIVREDRSTRCVM